MGERMPPPPVWDRIPPPARAPNALGMEMGSEWTLTPALPSHICFKATGEVSCTILLFFSIFSAIMNGSVLYMHFLSFFIQNRPIFECIM